MGGLRFKTSKDGEYLSNDKDYATPPWASLRELEQASIAFEQEENVISRAIAPIMLRIFLKKHCGL